MRRSYQTWRQLLLVIIVFGLSSGRGECQGGSPIVEVNIYFRGWGILADDSKFENLESVRRAARTHISTRGSRETVMDWIGVQQMEDVPKAAITKITNPLLIIDVNGRGASLRTFLAKNNFLYTEDGARRIWMSCEFKLSIEPTLWASGFSEKEVREFVCGAD